MPRKNFNASAAGQETSILGNFNNNNKNTQPPSWNQVRIEERFREWNIGVFPSFVHRSRGMKNYRQKEGERERVIEAMRFYRRPIKTPFLTRTFHFPRRCREQSSELLEPTSL